MHAFGRVNLYQIFLLWLPCDCFNELYTIWIFGFRGERVYTYTLKKCYTDSNMFYRSNSPMLNHRLAENLVGLSYLHKF